MNQPGQTPVPIYTIGYGSRTLSAMITILRHFEIFYLVDVRSAPYSRYKPEFSQAALAASLRTAGITYLFMGDTLGGRPDDPTLYTNRYADYDKIRQTARYVQGIERLRTAFTQGQRIVLMCSEGKPEQCHRSKLIGATLAELTIPVLHIDENDQTITQDEVSQRREEGQLSLFGDWGLTSRRRYPQDDADHER